VGHRRDHGALRDRARRSETAAATISLLAVVPCRPTQTGLPWWAGRARASSVNTHHLIRPFKSALLAATKSKGPPACLVISDNDASGIRETP
jgi:hypothetical protein